VHLAGGGTTDEFVVDDMSRGDLKVIGWSGSASHLREVAKQLNRRDLGEVDYLVVRDPDGVPVCKGGVDWRAADGVGTIWQLATKGSCQGHGHARRLIAEAERRIRDRGLPRARLAVEPDNARARSLYLHLGYVPVGERETGWDYEQEDGSMGFYSTTVIDMEKPL
jgi:ribosomal protein S18 acetylase RimI-like enzyme